MKILFRMATATAVMLMLGISLKAQSPATAASPVSLTADSLASGDYKTVLTSFFQLSLNDLTGPGRELKFSSNPCAIMAKGRPSLLVDTNYVKYHTLRGLNFNFALKLDSSYHFNGFSSGATFAIINKRDYAISRQVVDQAFSSESAAIALHKKISAYASKIKDTAAYDKFVDQINLYFRDTAFNKLDKAVQDTLISIAKNGTDASIYKQIVSNPGKGFLSLTRAPYDSLVAQFQNRPLWTVSLDDTTYNNQFLFSKVQLTTEFLKGVLDPKRKSNIELDIKGSALWSVDTGLNNKNLQRILLTFTPGVNWVLKGSDQKPWAEFKASGSYNRLAGEIYKGENRSLVTLNGTISIKIIDDIWIPLQITYDPKKGNVFGLLNVAANFTALKSALGKL